MDSEIDWKLYELLGPESCDQQLKVELDPSSVSQGASWISSTVQPSEHSWMMGQSTPSGVCRQYRTGRSVWWAVWFCSPSQGPGWTGEVSREEPHGTPQREVRSPAPGEVPPGLSKGECCGEVMMPSSSALLRHIWKALAGSGLPGRTGQVPLWQRGGSSFTGSKQWGLFCSVCLEIVWKGEWMVRWWNL